jgi:PAS domain S-box-containing protein
MEDAHRKKVRRLKEEVEERHLIAVSEPSEAVHQQAEQTLREIEDPFSLMFQGHNAVMLLIDPESGQIVDANRAAELFYGYPRAAFLTMRIEDINTLSPEEVAAERRRALAEERNYFQFRHQLANGQVRTVNVHSSPIDIKQRKLLYSIIYDTTDRVQAEAALAESEALFRGTFEQAAVGIAQTLPDGSYLKINQRYCDIVGYSREELFESNYREITHPDDRDTDLEQVKKIQAGEIQTYPHEKRYVRKDSSIVWVNLTISVVSEASGVPKYFIGAIQDITDRKQTETELVRLYGEEQQRAEFLTSLQQIGDQLARLRSQDDVMDTVVNLAKKLVDSSAACSVMLIDEETNEACMAAHSGLPKDTPDKIRIPMLPIFQQVINTGQPVLVADIDQNVPELREILVHPNFHSFYAYPLHLEERVYGFLFFTSLIAQLPSSEKVMALTMLAERTALALENARLFEETQRSLRRVAALRSIDQAISSSLDIKLTLGMVLQHTIEQLKIDAAGILLYDPNTQIFRHVVRRGFRTTALKHSSLYIGKGYSGRAALEGRTILVPDLASDHNTFKKSPNFGCEGFCSMVTTPLVAKGQILGVLEVFHREPLNPPPDWLEFLETLAGQAAIAIDSIQLFEQQQRSNIDLIAAYQATIMGWSRALDLRDQETEGHSGRVTETTLQIAREFGIKAADLVHIERGALLHDIGKMGVPDSILLKPGPLTDEEWILMRQHPQFAYDLLSPVVYLRPALDIPYCHHEKWDGSGYPRRLTGEHIPLAARMFAVVDVWDALTSDRPYRAAWPEKKALAHIAEQAGTHFDPRVVDAFLGIMQEQLAENKASILIVDDETDVAQTMAETLNNQYHVWTAASGKEALEILAHTEIAVILTDYFMPGMDGIQLLEQVYQTKPDIAGILFSGQINQEILSRAINLRNVRGFISKPCNIDELQQRLTEALIHHHK